MIGEEGDENGDVKTKEKWFGKQNRKEDEAWGKENENKDDGKNEWFLKQDKRKLMTTNCQLLH